jgi:hypothetical protein
MHDAPKSSAVTSRGWAGVRPHLASWNKTELLALVKDLYAASEFGRDLVEARCRPAESTEEALEKYRRRIVEQFFPARGYGKLKLGEARKAVRDYRKATDDLAGTAELLMTYVETGVRYTCEFGDIDARFYSSVESALIELANLLRDKVRERYPQFQNRLSAIEQMTEGIGWGFHDVIGDVVRQLEDELGDG